MSFLFNYLMFNGFDLILTAGFSYLNVASASRAFAMSAS